MNLYPIFDINASVNIWERSIMTVITAIRGQIRGKISGNDSSNP
jgi:hypothetical protein